MDEMEMLTALLEIEDIKCVRDGYTTLPKEHAFADWRIAHRKLEGADDGGLYWKARFELRIWYRDKKTPGDWRREKRLERGMAELDGLESEYDYNSDDKLDMTLYTFSGIIDF